MNHVQDGEPDAGKHNTNQRFNQAGKPVLPGTVFEDKDPEYLPDHERDSVWDDAEVSDADNPTA